MGKWWRDGQIHRAQSVSLRTKCERVVSHVFSTALNGSVHWPWGVERVLKSQTMGVKDLETDLRPRMNAFERNESQMAEDAFVYSG